MQLSNILQQFSNILQQFSNILQQFSNILLQLSNILQQFSYILLQISNILQQHRNLSLSDVHLIGFSLGAHIAGIAGARVKGIGRISGESGHCRRVAISPATKICSLFVKYEGDNRIMSFNLIKSTLRNKFIYTSVT